MSEELALVKLLGESKDNYERYIDFVDPAVFSSDECKTLVKDLGSWFSSYEDLTWPGFRVWFHTKQHPKLTEEQRIVYNALFDQIPKVDLSKEGVACDIASHFIERHYGKQIADLGMQLFEGTGKYDINDAIELIETAQKEIDRPYHDDKQVEMDLEHLNSKLYNPNGLEWRLEELNKSVGTPSGLILVGARKDAGKSTFLWSEGSHFMQQSGKPIFVFTNEEGGESVGWRFVQSMFGLDDDTLNKDILKYNIQRRKIFEETGGLQLYQKVFHWQDIVRRLKGQSPCAIIVDQLSNCQGFNKQAGNEVARQDMLFMNARQVAQDYECPFIAVHQLGGAAEGQRHPDISMFYGSQTGIQKHADVVITIGKESMPSNTRWINIMASKLGKGPRVDKNLRHANFEVEILPEIARFKGIY